METIKDLLQPQTKASIENIVTGIARKVRNGVGKENAKYQYSHLDNVNWFD